MNESSPFAVDSIGGSERCDVDGADDDTGMKNENDSSDDADTIAPSLEYNYQYVPIPQSFTTDQLDRISAIEEAASNVQRVLAKYGNASTLPSSLDPNDIITGKLSGWEIDPNSPWADTSMAIREIVAAGERLARAWSLSTSDDVDNKGSMDDAPTQEHQKKEKEWWQSILSNDDPQQNKCSVSSSESIRRNGGGGGDDDAVASGIPPTMDEPFTEEEELQFHDVYMEWATNAFEEELDALRKGQLDELTSARSKAKNRSTTTANTTTTTSVAASSMELLDPTQYSFVVTAGSAKGDDSRKGVDNDADVSAAEATRIASVKEIDVRVLSDMLSSVSNILTLSEKRMLLQARRRAVLQDAVAFERDDTGATIVLTLHERRKREIGLC